MLQYHSSILTFLFLRSFREDFFLHCSLTMSAAFSAMTTVAALVFAETIVGMMLASTTLVGA